MCYRIRYPSAKSLISLTALSLFNDGTEFFFFVKQVVYYYFMKGFGCQTLCSNCYRFDECAAAFHE